MRSPDSTSHDLIVSGKPGANPYGGTGGEAWSCQSGYDYRTAETGSEGDGCNLGRTYHPVECSVRKYGGVTVQSGRCGMQYSDHDTAQKMPGVRTGRNQCCRRSLPQSGADPGRGLRDGKRAYFLLYVHPVDYRNGRWCSNRIACFVSIKKYKNIVTKVVKLRTHLLIKILTCIRIVVNIF